MKQANAANEETDAAMARESPKRGEDPAPSRPPPMPNAAALACMGKSPLPRKDLPKTILSPVRESSHMPNEENEASPLHTALRPAVVEIASISVTQGPREPSPARAALLERLSSIGQPNTTAGTSGTAGAGSGGERTADAVEERSSKMERLSRLKNRVSGFGSCGIGDGSSASAVASRPPASPSPVRPPATVHAPASPGLLPPSATASFPAPPRYSPEKRVVTTTTTATTAALATAPEIPGLPFYNPALGRYASPEKAAGMGGGSLYSSPDRGARIAAMTEQVR